MIDFGGPIFAPILEQKPHLVFLGYRNGTPYFSVDISFIDDPQAIPELQAIGDFTDIRDISLDLPRKDGGLLAYSRAIAQWHKTHQFCNRCGHRLAKDTARDIHDRVLSKTKIILENLI